jgi:putative tryptophan/tyrosine transport system substrate-binding protein
MRRRDFMAGIGAATALPAGWALAARAQQPARMRRVGVLSQFSESQARANTDVFKLRLRELGWVEGGNISFELRWGARFDLETRRRYARELVALAPDVIMTSAAVAVEALQEQTRAIPIVFSGAIDPVGGGLVEVWRGRAATRPVF